MSDEAAARLARWDRYLGPNATDEEWDDAKRRWERGEEPPSQDS